MQKKNVAAAATTDPASNISIRPANDADLHAITKLHEEVFGPGRFARTAYRVREGTASISNYCRVATHNGKLLGAVRMTNAKIGPRPGVLLLGPLVVAPSMASTGLGAQLIADTLEAAQSEGIELVVLIGDEPYYGKQGFSQVPHGQVTFPGPVDPARILAAQLKPESLKKFSGTIVAE